MQMTNILQYSEEGDYILSGPGLSLYFFLLLKLHKGVTFMVK